MNKDVLFGLITREEIGQIIDDYIYDHFLELLETKCKCNNKNKCRFCHGTGMHLTLFGSSLLDFIIRQISPTKFKRK